MNLFGISKIEKRIIQIKHILADKKREKDMATGISMGSFEARLKIENRPLLEELDELKTEREFIHDRQQLWINIFSIGIALFVAFFVPYWQDQIKQKNDIQSVYQTVIANQDIFISNEDEFINAKRTGIFTGLPQPYIQYDLDQNTLKSIQKNLGVIQYQFFLYYLNQTNLLNSEIHQLQSNFVVVGSKSLKDLDPIKTYTSAMNYLADEGTDAKFVYINDTTCLVYLFQKAFPEIRVDEREKNMECSLDSLVRLSNFGFIPVDTPKWLLPGLKDAINSKQPGLGDRLIQNP